ncbi:hypothetical protein [Bifidobacterium sp. UBA744]|nr:hypothetical protein [Bifidobacterium sp. UBA744]
MVGVIWNFALAGAGLLGAGAVGNGSVVKGSSCTVVVKSLSSMLVAV